MHRALAALRAETSGSSRTVEQAITQARINCAKYFIAPDNVAYADQRLVAIGTDDGVYIGSYSLQSGFYTTWIKALTLTQITQIDVLEDFDILLILANPKRELITYTLNDVLAHTLPTSDPGAPQSPAKLPRHLLGSDSVGFFTIGKLKNRTLVIYQRRNGATSVFKALEPVERKDNRIRKSFRGRKATELFREYDVYA